MRRPQLTLQGTPKLFYGANPLQSSRIPMMKSIPREPTVERYGTTTAQDTAAHSMELDDFLQGLEAKRRRQQQQQQHEEALATSPSPSRPQKRRPQQDKPRHSPKRRRHRKRSKPRNHSGSPTTTTKTTPGPAREPSMTLTQVFDETMAAAPKTPHTHPKDPSPAPSSRGRFPTPPITPVSPDHDHDSRRSIQQDIYLDIHRDQQQQRRKEKQRQQQQRQQQQQQQQQQQMRMLQREPSPLPSPRQKAFQKHAQQEETLEHSPLKEKTVRAPPTTIATTTTTASPEGKRRGWDQGGPQVPDLESPRPPKRTKQHPPSSSKKKKHASSPSSSSSSLPSKATPYPPTATSGRPPPPPPPPPPHTPPSPSIRKQHLRKSSSSRHSSRAGKSHSDEEGLTLDESLALAQVFDLEPGRSPKSTGSRKKPPSTEERKRADRSDTTASTGDTPTTKESPLSSILVVAASPAAPQEQQQLQQHPPEEESQDTITELKPVTVRRRSLRRSFTGKDASMTLAEVFGLDPMIKTASITASSSGSRGSTPEAFGRLMSTTPTSIAGTTASEQDLVAELIAVPARRSSWKIHRRSSLPPPTTAAAAAANDQQQPPQQPRQKKRASLTSIGSLRDASLTLAEVFGLPTSRSAPDAASMALDQKPHAERGSQQQSKGKEKHTRKPSLPDLVQEPEGLSLSSISGVVDTAIVKSGLGSYGDKTGTTTTATTTTTIGGNSSGSFGLQVQPIHVVVAEDARRRRVPALPEDVMKEHERVAAAAKNGESSISLAEVFGLPVGSIGKHTSRTPSPNLLQPPPPPPPPPPLEPQRRHSLRAPEPESSPQSRSNVRPHHESDRLGQLSKPPPRSTSLHPPGKQQQQQQEGIQQRPGESTYPQSSTQHSGDGTEGPLPKMQIIQRPGQADDSPLQTKSSRKREEPPDEPEKKQLNPMAQMFRKNPSLPHMEGPSMSSNAMIMSNTPRTTYEHSVLYPGAAKKEQHEQHLAALPGPPLLLDVVGPPKSPGAALPQALQRRRSLSPVPPPKGATTTEADLLGLGEMQQQQSDASLRVPSPLPTQSRGYLPTGLAASPQTPTTRKFSRGSHQSPRTENARLVNQLSITSTTEPPRVPHGVSSRTMVQHRARAEARKLKAQGSDVSNASNMTANHSSMGSDKSDHKLPFDPALVPSVPSDASARTMRQHRARVEARKSARQSPTIPAGRRVSSVELEPGLAPLPLAAAANASMNSETSDTPFDASLPQAPPTPNARAMRQHRARVEARKSGRTGPSPSGRRRGSSMPEGMSAVPHPPLGYDQTNSDSLARSATSNTHAMMQHRARVEARKQGRRSIAASQVEPAQNDGAADTPEQTGRYGTALGTAFNSQNPNSAVARRRMQAEQDKQAKAAGVDLPRDSRSRRSRRSALQRRDEEAPAETGVPVVASVAQLPSAVAYEEGNDLLPSVVMPGAFSVRGGDIDQMEFDYEDDYDNLLPDGSHRSRGSLGMSKSGSHHSRYSEGRSQHESDRLARDYELQESERHPRSTEQRQGVFAYTVPTSNPNVVEGEVVIEFSDEEVEKVEKKVKRTFLCVLCVIFLVGISLAVAIPLALQSGSPDVPAVTVLTPSAAPSSTPSLSLVPSLVPSAAPSERPWLMTVPPLTGSDFGTSIDLAGPAVAVGSPGGTVGRIQVFQWETGQQIGQDVVGSGIGGKLSLSSDGNTLVSCSSTLVNVHRYNNVTNMWDRVAHTTANRTVFDLSEIVAFAASDDASVLALATQSRDGARFYSLELFANNTLRQRGQTFASPRAFGIWLSGDGSFMILGEAQGFGVLRFKRFHRALDTWVDGAQEEANELTATLPFRAVALSQDATLLAAIDGSSLSVLEYSNTFSAFFPLGTSQDIASNNTEKFDLAITPEGNHIAVGVIAPGAMVASVQVFRFDGTDWVMHGTVVQVSGGGGTLVNTVSVSLAPNATQLAVGTTFLTEQNTVSGTVGFYSL